MSQFTGCFNIYLHSIVARNVIRLTQSGFCEAALYTYEGIRIECISLKRVKPEHVDNRSDQHCSFSESVVLKLFSTETWRETNPNSGSHLGMMSVHILLGHG